MALLDQGAEAAHGTGKFLKAALIGALICALAVLVIAALPCAMGAVTVAGIHVCSLLTAASWAGHFLVGFMAGIFSSGLCTLFTTPIGLAAVAAGAVIGGVASLIPGIGASRRSSPPPSAPYVPTYIPPTSPVIAKTPTISQDAPKTNVSTAVAPECNTTNTIIVETEGQPQQTKSWQARSTNTSPSPDSTPPRP